MGVHKTHSRGRCPGNRRIWKHSMLHVFSMAFILFLSALDLLAQTTSTIEGTVKDKQGLAVAGAQVRTSNTALAVDLAATTDSDGSYRISTLPPGVYEIKASKDGFSNQNPLGPQNCNVFQPVGQQPGIGTIQQYLPGREGQIGIRFEF